VMVYITLVNFWGVAGRLFNLRQGKRIFGLISIGEVVSIIIGYFSIPLILRFLKTPDLLFLTSFSLFISLIMVFILFRTFKDQLHTVTVPAGQTQTKTKSEWNYWNLVKKPYFLLISVMALLPIFGYLFVDFLFLAQTKVEFANNPETLARFFGIFLGSTAVLELILKFFSGRFLNKYGLKPSLLCLPIILLLSILLAAIFGSLYGTVGMFFAFIALARFFERSVRAAVYEPAFQLLYQPVPAEQRLPFQNQIEGIPKALGTVITGVVILLFSSIPAFNLVHFNWLFIVILGFWIWIAYKMYEEYRNMLKTKLSELKHKERNAQEPMTALIRQTFSNAKPGQFQPLVDLFEKVDPVGLETALEGVAKASDDKIIDAEDTPFEKMVELTRSDDPKTRVNAARLLGTSGRYNTYKLLIHLLKDPDPNVKKAALISSGKIKRVELWPLIIENLVIPEYSHSAKVALEIIGEPMLQEVDRFFEKISEYKPVQLKILRIYESIGGEKAIKLLRKKIYYPDKDIRFQALLSLSNLEYHASPSEIPFIKQTIEDSVDIMVWLMASLVDIRATNVTQYLQLALLQEMEEKKEHIFLLLSLLYDSKTISHIRGHIESQDTNAKIYALEISDMLISSDIKELFLPIFDDLSIHDRLNRFSQRFPQEKLTLFARLADIINKDYSKINRWTKACAIDILSHIPSDFSEQTEELLAANMVNPDPLLGELAAWILFKDYRNYYIDTIVLFDKKDAIRLSGIIRKIKSREKNADLLIFEKVLILKNNEFFAPVDETQILDLIVGSHELEDTSDHDAQQANESLMDAMVITSEEGYSLHIPRERLYELMTGDPVMTERYLRLFFNNNNA
jgi:ATP:ADP antiporter, AAA family